MNRSESDNLFNCFGTLLEDINDMCYTYNADGCITYVNQKLLDTMHYTREEALGRHCLDFTPPDCHPAQKEELDRILREGQPGQHETLVIDKSNQKHLISISTLPMIEDNKISGGLAVARDITKQRQLEEALLVNQQKYAKIMQCSPQILIISTLEDGTILEINDSALAICGYRRENVIGNNTLSANFWVDPNERQRGVEILQQGIPLRNYEFLFRDRAGNEHTGLWSADTMELEGKTCIVTIIIDITDRIKTEQALQQLKEKSARAGQMAAMGALSAGVVHEIAQPINALKILTNTILYSARIGQPLPMEKMITYLGDINDEITHLEDIIHHMRSLAPANSTSPLEDCDINICIRNALGLLERQISSHGIRLKKTLGRNLPLIRANPQGLEIVIVNLIINAMQALDDTDRPDKTIRILTMDAGDAVILQVTDNGDGIISEQLGQIFEPFCTTKKSNNMGLGLSLVQTVVTSLGGKVQCWNDDPVGATFQVELPLLG